MGTPDFAVPTLKALHQAGHEIAVVYCQPPKPVGRGHQIKKTPVHEMAESLGIEVRTPKSLKSVEEQQKFADLKLDAAVVVAYGLILPQAFLDAPRLGCLNIHFSLLPRWRGAAPVPRAIMAGDKMTGICIMQMAAGLDTGDILLQKEFPVPFNATSGSFLAELAELGASLTLKALEGRNNGTLKPVPQVAEGVTYAAKLKREDGCIDWSKPASEIDCQIRGLQPWPGAFFMLGNESIKVIAADIIDIQGAPGTLLDDQFTVACGDKALRLTRIQRPGKNATDGASLLRGLRLSIGSQL